MQNELLPFVNFKVKWKRKEKERKKQNKKERRKERGRSRRKPRQRKREVTVELLIRKHRLIPENAFLHVIDKSSSSSFPLTSVFPFCSRGEMKIVALVLLVSQVTLPPSPSSPILIIRSLVYLGFYGLRFRRQYWIFEIFRNCCIVTWLAVFHVG